MAKVEPNLLFKHYWMKVFESEKGFIYCQRKGTDSVAALLFRHTDDGVEFLIHYQPMPEIDSKKSWDDCYPCVITGTIEPSDAPLATVIAEVEEEGGIVVSESNLVAHNVIVASTQMNERVYSFLFNATDLEQKEPKTDGSIFEAVAFNKWLSEAQLRELISNELVLSSLTNLYQLYLIKYANK